MGTALVICGGVNADIALHRLGSRPENAVMRVFRLRDSLPLFAFHGLTVDGGTRVDVAGYTDIANTQLVIAANAGVVDLFPRSEIWLDQLRVVFPKAIQKSKQILNTQNAQRMDLRSIHSATVFEINQLAMSGRQTFVLRFSNVAPTIPGTSIKFGSDGDDVVLPMQVDVKLVNGWYELENVTPLTNNPAMSLQNISVQDVSRADIQTQLNFNERKILYGPQDFDAR